MFGLHKYFKKDHRIGYSEWPAYLCDIYRVFPRLAMFFISYLTYICMIWYMHLPSIERGTEVSVFCGLVFGAWVKCLDYYMQRGNDWSKRMQLNGGEQGNVTNPPQPPSPG